MQLARDRLLAQPRGFGRGPVRVLGAEAPSPALSLSEDFKLFATTFAAGFLFVTFFIG